MDLQGQRMIQAQMQHSPKQIVTSMSHRQQNEHTTRDRGRGPQRNRSVSVLGKLRFVQAAKGTLLPHKLPHMYTQTCTHIHNRRHKANQQGECQTICQNEPRCACYTAILSKPNHDRTALQAAGLVPACVLSHPHTMVHTQAPLCAHLAPIVCSS